MVKGKMGVLESVQCIDGIGEGVCIFDFTCKTLMMPHSAKELAVCCGGHCVVENWLDRGYRISHREVAYNI